MKKLYGAIFDLDGTLLDTMYIWSHLCPEFLRRHDIEFDGDINELVAVMSVRHAVKFMISKFALPVSPEEAQAELFAILDDYYRQQAFPKPGAVKFLKALQERKVKTVILSATPARQLETALRACGLEQLFTHAPISCHSTGVSKQHPEAFLNAAAILQLPPDEVMVFEDAWYAGSTAKAAGFPLCAIYDQTNPRPEELRSLADCSVESSWDEFPLERFF